MRQARCFSKSTKCLLTADFLRILGFHVGQRTPGGVPQSPAWTGSISKHHIKLESLDGTLSMFETLLSGSVVGGESTKELLLLLVRRR